MNNLVLTVLGACAVGGLFTVHWGLLLRRTGLTIVLTTAPKATSPRTSAGRSSVVSMSVKRRRSHAPVTASRVLPVAMAAATRVGSCAMALAKNAPTQIPGHTPRPSSSTAASAMPVGGQTNVTCSTTNAIVRPSLAARK